MPDGVTAIGISALAGCKNLRRVTLPDMLEYIGRCAFAGCTALEEIVIPGSVKSIDGLAFWNSGLKRAVIKHGVEKIDEKYYEKRFTFIKEFELITDFESGIFDFTPDVTSRVSE